METFTNKDAEICLIVKFCENTKMSKFGTKKALFENFWTRILKNYWHISNQHPRICLIAKLDKIEKDA